MQEADKKPKRVGRHAAFEPEAEEELSSPGAEKVAGTDSPAEAELEGIDDYDLIGGEDDVPIRSARNRSKRSNGKPQKVNGKRKQGHRSSNRQEELFSERRFRQKRSLIDILTATDEDSFFKPLTIFGHKIRFWPLFLLAMFVMMAGVVIINNSNLELNEQPVVVVGLPEDLENYRIMVLSDLNGRRFGDQQSALIREIENIDYDMILCVGDMVGKRGDPEPFYEFLDNLERPDRVYFICGDADPGPFVDSPREIQGTLNQLVLEDWILGAIDRGAHYIDVPISIEVGEARLWFTPTIYLNLDCVGYRDAWLDEKQQEENGVVNGLQANYDSLPFTSYRYEQAQRFYSAVRTIEPTDMLIGLSHQVPDDEFISSASTHDQMSDNYLFEPELIVSGHYCGGMWHLPLLGAFYVPNKLLPREGWFPAKEDVSGLSTIGESQVFITGGLANTSALPLLPFRVLNDPEIAILTLTAKLPDNMLEVQ